MFQKLDFPALQGAVILDGEQLESKTRLHFAEGDNWRTGSRARSWRTKKRDKAVWRLHEEGVLMEAEGFLSSHCGDFRGWTDEALDMFVLAQLNALCKPCFPLRESLQ